jgi:putative colanic acid biosysnthesis UDP-glucose lipid carrier transferase
VPWTVPVGTLCMLLDLAAVPGGAGRSAAVVLVGVACLFLVELPRPLSLKGSWGHLPLAATVFLRWLGILAVTGVVLAFTDVLAAIPLTVFAIWALVSPLALVAVRTLLRKLLARLVTFSVTPRRAVVAGYGEPSASLVARLRANPDLFIDFRGYFDDRSAQRLALVGDDQLLGRLGDLTRYVRAEGIHIVFVALPLRTIKRVADLMDELHDTTVSVYFVPDIFVFNLIQARATDIDGQPVVAMRETPLQGYNMLIKRVTDVVLGSAMLVMLAPVMLLAALAIRLTSAGPVLFRQVRYGFDGERIQVYKFRTMTATTNTGPVVQATRDDPRITPVGLFLRRTSIDELPQLFNVLAGTMSLVGPRPHAVDHNETYRHLIKGYMTRHKVLPGITGLAQVSGCRGETAQVADMARRVAYDIEYMRTWSPLLDARILLQTVVRVWRDKQAY